MRTERNEFKDDDNGRNPEVQLLTCRGISCWGWDYSGPFTDSRRLSKSGPFPGRRCRIAGWGLAHHPFRRGTWALRSHPSLHEVPSL